MRGKVGGNINKLWKTFALFVLFIVSAVNCFLMNGLAQARSNMEINIFLPEAINNPTQLKNLENRWSIKFTSAKWYLDWSDDFTPHIAAGIKAQNIIPELTWQPQINGACISYQAVTAGQYDVYLNRFITSLKNSGLNIRINLAPEMNGTWSPWGIGNCNNSAGDFRAFWQYVVSQFRANGVSVTWIWAPNVHYWGEPVRYADIFPGDNYIDYTGLEGYNWGTSQSWSTWQSFRNVFQASYNDLVALSGKNIMIAEMASTEIGGNKAQWILDMFYDLHVNFPRITGITWFNMNKETDWRINSSPASESAFQQGANDFYRSSGSSYSGNRQLSSSNQKNKFLPNAANQSQNDQAQIENKIDQLKINQNNHSQLAMRGAVLSVTHRPFPLALWSEIVLLTWLFSSVVIFSVASLFFK